MEHLWMISFELSMMFDTIEFYMVHNSWTTFTFTQGHRGARKWKLYVKFSDDFAEIQYGIDTCLFDKLHTHLTYSDLYPT